MAKVATAELGDTSLWVQSNTCHITQSHLIHIFIQILINAALDTQIIRQSQTQLKEIEFHCTPFREY